MINVLVWYGNGGSCCVNRSFWKNMEYIMSNLNEQGVLTEWTGSSYRNFSTHCNPTIQKERRITTLTLSCCIPWSQNSNKHVHEDLLSGYLNQSIWSVLYFICSVCPFSIFVFLSTSSMRVFALDIHVFRNTKQSLLSNQGLLEKITKLLPPFMPL